MDLEVAMENKLNEWIQTYTGKKFYPNASKPEDICIQDIAHALSMLCRFTGHCKFFYSVAQHSVLVSYLCDKKNSRTALLHDASEAYIADINSIVKRLPELEGYKVLEAKIQTNIYTKFGLNTEPDDVKQADYLALCIEAKTLMSPLHPDWKININLPPVSILELSPKQSEELFLARFKELFGEDNE